MKLQKWMFFKLSSMVNYSVLLLLLFSFCKSYCQKDSLDCWEGNTNYNDAKFEEKHYILIVKKTTIEISINNIHKYKYKFHKENGIRYFIMNQERMILDERNIKNVHIINIKYFYKKMRESVDEITILEFKKC